MKSNSYNYQVILTFIMLTFAVKGMSQKGILKGQILDKSSNKPIEMVKIYIPELKTVTYSYEDGSYIMDELPMGEYIATLTHVAYFDKKVKVIINKENQTVITFLEPKEELLSPIVITGTRTEHRIDNAPVQTEIITKNEIAAYSGKSLEEVISRISSSLDFTQSSMGSNIRINGLGKDYVLFLINGNRMSKGIGGFTDLNRINTDDIEQIEIIKGASSTLYGSDAIGGVINIITKKSLNKIEFTNDTRQGEYGFFRQANTFSFNKNKLKGKTSFNYKQKNGYQLNHLKFNSKWKDNHNLPYLVETYYRPVNETKSYAISQFLEYQVNERLSLNTNLSWDEKRLFFPFRAQMHNYYYNNRAIDLNGKYQLEKGNYLTCSFNYNNYLYYSEYPYKYNKTYFTRDDVIKVTYYPGDRFQNQDQKNTVFLLKGFFNLNKKHKLSVGAESMGEFLIAQYQITKPDVKAFTHSVFIQDEWEISKKMTSVFGLRTIYHSISGFAFTPSATLMYKTGQFVNRLTYSKGFKSPTLKELYYYYESNRMGAYRLYLGNSDLKPQKSNYLSYSLEYKIKKFKSGVNLYYNKVNDKISYQIIPTEYFYRLKGIEETKKRYNIGETRSIGIDLHATTKIFKTFKISGSYSYVDAQNLTEKVRLNGVSEHSVTLKIDYSKSWNSYRLNLMLSGVHKSDKFYLEEDLERMYAKPYQLCRVVTNHTFKNIKKMNLTFTAGIDNIFDYVDRSPYGSHYGTLNPGRTYFFGLRINYKNQQK